MTELGYGRAIVDWTAATPPRLAIIVVLEDAVTDMQARAAVLAGGDNATTPRPHDPFVVLVR